MNSFKNSLRKIRKSKNMTQVELARKSGLTQVWICHFENGRREPSLRNLIKLADSLCVSLDLLTGRENGIDKRSRCDGR